MKVNEVYLKRKFTKTEERDIKGKVIAEKKSSL